MASSQKILCHILLLLLWAVACPASSEISTTSSEPHVISNGVSEAPTASPGTPSAEEYGERKSRIKLMVLDTDGGRAYFARALRMASAVVFVVFLSIFLYVLRKKHISSSHEKLRGLLELLPFQAGVVDRQGNLLFFREGGEKTLCARRMPSHISELPSELQHAIEEKIQDVFQNGQQCSCDYCSFGKFHKIDFWLLDEGTFDVSAVMWLSSDVTMLHCEHSAAMQMEQRYRQTMNSIVDAVISIDFDEKILNANPAAERMLGYDHESMTGKRFDECVKLKNTGLQGSMPILTRVIQSGIDLTLGQNCTLTLASGSVLEVEGTVSPIRSDENMVVGAVFFFRDVTAERRRNDQLREAVDHIQTAVVDRNDVLLKLSKEFHTTLTEMAGYSRLLRDNKNLPEECRYDVQQLSVAGEQLQRQLTELLKLKGGTGRNDGDGRSRDSVDILLLFSEMLRVFQYSAEGNGIALDMHTPAELPKFDLPARPLRQLLLHLMQYVLSLLHSGEHLTLTASYSRDRLLIQLQCSYSEKLVQDCTVLSGYPSKEPADCGSLPLTIARQLCAQTNGRLVANARKATDAMPELMIGIVYDSPKSLLTSIDIAGTTAKNSTEGLPSAPPCPCDDAVILIDDVKFNLMHLSRLFAKIGIRHFCCSSAQEAVKQINGGARIRAVFTDLWMPDVNGVDFARRMASSPETAGIPVYLVTADTNLPAEIAGQFKGVIYKPVEPSKLLECVRWLLPPSDE